MKVSEITVKEVAEHLKLDEINKQEIEAILESAKSYIRSFTGLSDEEIDRHEDFYIVVLVLCQDMYDNRCMYVEKNTVNKVIETILGMHCVNLL